jgi:hypothetical protein
MLAIAEAEEHLGQVRLDTCCEDKMMAAVMTTNT